MIEQEYRLDNTETILKKSTQEMTQRKKVQDIEKQFQSTLQKVTSLKEQLEKQKPQNAQALETLDTIKFLLKSFKHEKEFFQTRWFKTTLITN
ncbi:hypothetical protein [Clostridioides difficile]|uniref:hypothetical protein n=1 Tax=Clostridioides difficile TaxID=1496 RepID=UPI002FD07F38